MDSTGPQAALSDQWAAKVSCSSLFRLVCLAWLIPAVSMVWVGFGAIGLRPIDRPSFDAAFDRIQAVAILLTIFGNLIGLIWALRVWAYLPAIERTRAASGRFGPMSHVGSGLVMLSALLLAGIQPSARPVLLTLAALSGFHALSFIGRWLLRAPIMSPFPIAMLAFGSVFQVTIGWLHGAESAAFLAPLLVVEGLLLAWMAVAAAKAVAHTALADAAAAHFAYAARLAASGGETGRLAVGEEAVPASQAPTPQPLPAPAVGH